MAPYISLEETHRIVREVQSQGQTTQSLTWTTNDDSFAFSYYACWVDALDLWFLTGPRDWYATRDGIDSDQLAKLLFEEQPLYIYKCDRYQLVHHGNT